MLAGWLPPCLYAAFIFYLSSLSLPEATYLPLFFSADKVFHVAEYGVLGYLVARALGNYGLSKKKLFIRAVALCVLYGISDEVHQMFVPHRYPSVMDILADGIGSSLGIGISIKFKGRYYD
jgi:VanZ family protein